ncbi:hypothetical protein CPB86DRAFT_486485 [Serendipita vermifera]|nr:hypothetical protein CPB86DRAFT_486485 [Serendipita vermifera]
MPSGRSRTSRRACRALSKRGIEYIGVLKFIDGQAQRITIIDGMCFPNLSTSFLSSSSCTRLLKPFSHFCFSTSLGREFPVGNPEYFRSFAEVSFGVEELAEFSFTDQQPAQAPPPTVCLISICDLTITLSAFRL